MRSFISKIEHFYKLNTNVPGETQFSPGIQELRIPLYQREYKWTNEKIAELINDINSRDKFLGIIIFGEAVRLTMKLLMASTALQLAILLCCVI